MTDKPRLSELLLQWEEQHMQGRDISASDLCQECPELAGPLAERIAALKRLSWLNDRPEEPGCASESEPCLPPASQVAYRRGMEPIPGYVLLRFLGAGGFGQVWAAESPDGQLQALKIMQCPSRARIELQALERIRDLSHPMILPIYRVDSVGETLLVVSELADGSLQSLFELLRRLEPPFQLVKKCLSLLRCAAEALDFLQAYDLLHLDVKPANLLYVGLNWCKVCDFGTLTPIRPLDASLDGVVLSLFGQETEELATALYGSLSEVPWDQAIRRHATLFTRVGAFTPYYAPPEAFAGLISRSFDQYSLALTFCELIAGRIPFSGEGDSQIEQRTRGDLDLTGLPVELRPLIARALSPRPGERFPSCRALINELDRTLAAPQ
jgi:serine/threonine protein kinase